MRWKDSEPIAAALKYREAKYRTLGEFSFVDAEDRAARAVVNLIRIDLATESDDSFIRNYASNRRVFEQHEWRYDSPKPTHVMLEYRLVLHRCGGIDTSYSSGVKLSEDGCDFLSDLLTVARNLGFDCQTTDPRLDRWQSRLDDENRWASGKVMEFHMKNTKKFKIGDKVPWTSKRKATITGVVTLESGKLQYQIEDQWYHEDGVGHEILFEVRAYLNRNIHIRLNQRFALALNVEHGRLKGWIRTPAEAATELGDKEAAQFFSKNLQLGAGSLLMLGGS